MRPRLSIHIGAAEGPHGFADVPEAPAQAAAGRRIALGHGFSPTGPLTSTDDATVRRLGTWMEDAAAQARQHRGADLFISFTGHGRQARLDSNRRDRTGGPCDEDHYGLSEQWALHDGFLADDQLAAWYLTLPPGSRVVVLADCCFGLGSTFLPAFLQRAWLWWQSRKSSQILERASVRPEEVPAAVVTLATRMSGSLTKPGLIWSVERALADGASSWPDLVSEADVHFRSLHHGAGQVVACHFGQGGDAMWADRPLA